MRRILTLAAMVLLTASQPQSAVAAPTTSVDLVVSAQQIVGGLETFSGMPIVFLTRTGSDPGQFWYQAMQTLCTKTGQNWCDSDLSTVLTDTTNLLGWSRVLNYTGADGSNMSVCAILPPMPGISPGYTATALSSGNVYNWQELPSSKEAEAYLTLLHGAYCLNPGLNLAEEDKRANAFAAMSLALTEGDSAFVSSSGVTPARLFGQYIDANSTLWAVNVAERILLNQWEAQTVTILSSGGCNATAAGETNLATDSIQRDQSLPTNGNCSTVSGGTAQGIVSDENLWLWTQAIGSAGYPTVGMPPQPYVPFGGFPNLQAGVSYAWTTSDQLAQQYP